jgi:hypothetical protein
MYSYGNYIHEVTDKLYFTSNMCKDLRLPAFNLPEANKVITNTSHCDLKAKIAEGFNHFKFTEPKEKIFDFFEKFAYNENYSNNERNNIIENIRKQVISHLDINNEIIKNKCTRQRIAFQNDKFILTFGELVEYKLMVFIPSGMSVMCYYCYEIKIVDERKYNNIQPMRILSFLNEELYKAVQIGMDDFTGLGLSDVVGFLNDFNTKYILPELFSNLKRFIKELIEVKLRLPVNVTYLKKNMQIRLLNEIQTEEFSIEVYMDEDADYIFLKYSHELLNDNPVIFVDESICRVSFNELTSYNWEKLFTYKLKEFRKIHLHILTGRLSEICKRGIMNYDICIDQEMEKINFYFEKGLIFSIILNSRGGIEITDDEFLLKGKKDYYSNFHIIIKKLDMEEAYEYHNLLLKAFIESYFDLLSLSNTIEIIEKGFKITFALIDHNMHKLHLNLVIYTNRSYITLAGYSFTLFDEGGNETDITKHFDIFKNLLKNATNTTTVKELYSLLNNKNFFRFSKKFLKLVHSFITILLHTYEDFFRMFIDNYTLTPMSKVSPDMDFIIIDWTETREILQHVLTNFIEPENTDYFYKFFKRIQISTKNFIFRLYLQEEFIKTYFGLINLTSHCLFLYDYFIAYNKDDMCISIYYLTKINNRSDNNQIRKFFSKILNKIINFIRKTLPIINSNIN